MRFLGTFLADPASVPPGAVRHVAEQLVAAGLVADVGEAVRGLKLQRDAEVRWDHRADIRAAEPAGSGSTRSAQASLAPLEQAAPRLTASGRGRAPPPVGARAGRIGVIPPESEQSGGQASASGRSGGQDIPRHPGLNLSDYENVSEVVEDDQLTIPEVARILGIGENRAQGLVVRGDLPASGWPPRVRRSAVMEYIARSRIRPGQLGRGSNQYQGT